MQPARSSLVSCDPGKKISFGNLSMNGKETLMRWLVGGCDSQFCTQAQASLDRHLNISMNTGTLAPIARSISLLADFGEL